MSTDTTRPTGTKSSSPPDPTTLLMWIARLRIIQATAIVWLILVQLAALNLQGIPEIPMQIVVSTAALVLSLLAVAAPVVPSKKVLVLSWVVIVAELLCIGCATAYGAVSGFQLLFLLTLGKAALVFEDRVQVAVAAVLVCVIFVITAVPNQQLFVQSAQGFRETEGFLSVLFSRELLPWLIGGALMIVTGVSIRSEIAIRQELEALSQKLETLSAEMERSRVADEISSSVVSLVAQTKECLDTTSPAQSETADAERDRMQIEKAREFAGEALTQVRQALKVLRT